MDPSTTSRRNVLRGSALAGSGVLAGCLDAINQAGPKTDAGQDNTDQPLDPAQQLFVSPDGDDENDGTKDAPLGSLEAARDAIRSMKDDGALPEGGVAVEIMGGAYNRRDTFSLESQDSGSPESPIVWRAYKDERPTLHGGVKLSSEDFEPISGDARSRIPESARSDVVQIDLKVQGITDYGELKPTGKGLPIRPEPVTLYFDGDQQTLARYPNEGFVQTTEGPGWSPSRNITFGYDDETPESWDSYDDVWVWGRFHAEYHFGTASINSIDPGNNTITTGNEYIEYGIWKDRPYYYFNVLDELDAPGEWYIDRDTGMLYFYPPGDLEEGTIELSLLNTPMVSIVDTTNLTIDGLALTNGRSQGIVAEGIQDVTIKDCTLSQFGQHGLVVSNGAIDAPADFIEDPPAIGPADYESPLEEATQMTKRVTVDGCDFRGFSSSIINFDVGNQYKLESGESVIRNCELAEPGPTTAVVFKGVENAFRHNRLHHFPDIGVSFGGNDHVFEYNEVHHGCLDTGDTGAFYTFKSLENRGSVFRYNYIHDIQQGVAGGTGGSGTKFQGGIYFDSHSSGYEAHNNVFVNCDQGVHANGGRSLNVHDNLFIMCDWAIEFNDWWVNEEKCSTDKRLWGRLEQIPYQEGVWAERYPDLANIRNDDACTWGKYCSVTNNVAFRCGVGSGNANPFADEPDEVPDDTIGVDPGFMEHATVEGNIRTGTDPGFTETDEPTFQLNDDSMVFETIPEWEQFPIEQVGLQADETLTNRRGITTLPAAGSIAADVVLSLPELDVEGEIPAGETVQLGVGVYAYDGTELDVPIEEYTFTSGDGAIATVDDSGQLTAVAPGKTSVKATVTYDNHEVSHEIPVTIVSEAASGEPLSGTELLTYASTDASFNADGETLTIEANGNAIWSFADKYGAIFEQDGLGESGSVVVKLTEMSIHGEHTKAGIMVRNAIPGTGSSTGYVLVNTDSEAQIQMTWDSNNDGMIDSWENGESYSFPVWLKLERDGDTFTSYQSSDGQNWTEIGSVEMGTAKTTMDAGIFANSNSDSELTTAVFENFQVE